MLFTLGPLHADAKPSWADVPPVDVPGFTECVAIATARPAVVSIVRILDVAEIRLDRASAGFLAGRPRAMRSSAGGSASWTVASRIRCRCCSSWTPSTGHVRDRLHQGWVPTVELTSYVRALPAEGPLRVRQRARLVEAGFVDESCDVWDSRGRLVAQATQLASVRLATDAESFTDPARRVA